MSEKLKLYFVEDESAVVEAFKLVLDEKVQSLFFENLNDLLAADKAFAPDILFLDLCHEGDPNGEETVSRIPEFKRLYPDSLIYIQSGVQEVSTMKKAIEAGADRFLAKDNIAVELPLLIERFKATFKIRKDIDQMLVGSSHPMKSLKRELFNLRSESVDLLIQGETGTGKELCARSLHTNDPFIAVNCSAVPKDLFESEFFGHEKGAFSGATSSKKGYFESADCGTVFLDEVQSLSLDHQAKLLRVLESRAFMRVGSHKEIPFRARVLSASNENLKEAVREGKFREDLYYRLAPIKVELPPLRTRRDDVPQLLGYFLNGLEGSTSKKFSDDAVSFLQNDYEWPGNVRQLKGFVRSAALKCPIPVVDLDFVKQELEGEESELAKGVGSSSDNGAIDWSQGLSENLERLEKHIILKVTEDAKNAAEAIEKLKVSKSRYYEKLKSYKD